MTLFYYYYYSEGMVHCYFFMHYKHPVTFYQFVFKVLPELFHTVRTSDENLKDFITWGLGTLVSIVRQVYPH